MTISVSFEVFPPKTGAGLQTLASTVSQLDAVGPAYISVTYGAGGSDRDRSFETVDCMRQAVATPIAGHLTCVGQSRSEIDAVVDRYLALGVGRIVALRGDPAGGIDSAYEPHPHGYQSTADLVAAIKQRDARIDVAVSAYPERHPQSPTDRHDLDVLSAKVDAGADRAITQMFFDNAHYIDYVEQVRGRQIDVPIVPGIFPIHSFPAAARFASRCGATMPTAVAERFAGIHDDPVATHEVAIEVAAAQILALAEQGVEHVHIYTLNRAELALAVCDRLSLVTA